MTHKAGITLSILHISDMHFGCRDDNGEQENILKALETAVLATGKSIDCIVVTGDLTQKAEHSEFQQAQDWLSSLCQTLNTRCILVPGNHDTRRDHADSRSLRAAFHNRDAFGQWKDQIFSDHPHLNSFLEWYRQARNEHYELLNDWNNNPAIDKVDVNLSKINCRFICINTALLSCGDDDEDEHDPALNKLCADIKGINGGLKDNVAASTLIIAVAHHPASSLAPWNATELTKILGQTTGPHIYLHGHLHNLAHEAKYNNKGAGFFCGAAGAAYPGTKYKKQFSILTVDFDAQKVQSTAFEFNDESGTWDIDNSQSHPVPARLPEITSCSTEEVTANESHSYPRLSNPFSDVIANGIPPQYIHELFVEPSNSLVKLKNRLETIVEGQRGTGKTMLLRYFSFEVQQSLLSKENTEDSIIGLLNSTSTPFGVYCCLTNAGLNRSDFESVENDARRTGLFSHIAALFVLSRFFSALAAFTIQSTNGFPDDDLRKYTLRLLSLDYSLATIKGERFFKQLVREIDLLLRDAKQHVASLLPGGYPTNFNPWLSLPSLFPLLEDYKDALGMQVPFFLLIDDFDQLNAEQQSEFFAAASARRHDVVCYKFGIMSEGQKSFVAGDQRTYREGDDYNFVRLDWVDGGLETESRTSSYVKAVEEIFNKRMVLAQWPTVIRLGTLLDDWEHGNRLREEAKDLAKKDYENLRPNERPQTFESYWSKQGNAKYFRLLAKKKIAHRYAGRSTVIDLSSGIFRQFLEICSGIVDLALADGWHPSSGKRIGPEKQNKAIREWSKDMFRSLGSSGDVSSLATRGFAVTSENLINLANSLSRFFQNRLLSESKDPEVIAIAIKDSLSHDSFARCLLDVAVRESVLQRRSVDYPSKSGGGERLPTYNINRRLAPHVGIGTKLQGRHELDSAMLELAARDTEEFLKAIQKQDKASDQQVLL